MNKAFLLIGGNMGNREAYLDKARQEIERRCGNILKESSVYETEAWGIRDQQNFLNQVLEVETQDSAMELLRKILGIEEDLGRKRELKFGPRLIDIDILFFNSDVVCVEGLRIPHPEMQNRRFVLVPLAEIVPEKMHPVLKKTVTELLQQCPDDLEVIKVT